MTNKHMFKKQVSTHTSYQWFWLWVGGRCPKDSYLQCGTKIAQGAPKIHINCTNTLLFNTHFILAIFVSKPRLLENPSNLNDELSTKYTGYDTYDWYFLGNGSLHLNDQKEV